MSKSGAMISRYVGRLHSVPSSIAHFRAAFMKDMISTAFTRRSEPWGSMSDVRSSLRRSRNPEPSLRFLFQNCIPIFTDADPETFNMDPKFLKEWITEKTKTVIVGHIAGQPCDMDPIIYHTRTYEFLDSS